MNVQVKIEGVDRSEYVIEYSREHKICSGIGRLNVVLSITFPDSIDPWQTVDIWENGSFQVRYYVSDVVFSVPDSTITLECQDNSKRLVDYFIPDQYTVDYPSYTRYWIQKFLDEAGINYTFNTTSQGNLLSNFTSLGLTSGYDQIMQLLQLSGWYMYFDGNGVAIIGSLVKELSSISGTYNKTNILNITKISDDKMLRNRAVVWGAYNTLFQQYAFADLKTHTRWNYDHNDLRTMVISNSNIPNKASAVRIANILLKEFARITVEKHLTVAGASNRNLGDVVRVRSHVYNGTGMITTFGVGMSRDGLVTNLVLDERCPRLYGFFDFGDYVYVGTYGSGIWRKHIKFVHNWTNFSTGLTNLNITDLHINNDIFGAVAASGEMYYNESSDSNWTPLTITGLMSSTEDQLDVGTEIISGVIASGVAQMSFSGIMGRATIVDKQSNTIKFGVDTWSGLNYGDYFLQYSGLITSSGISQSGVNRGWIVEYNPFEGTTEDYPISVSGNFNIMVLDLENDGLNDYVSVVSAGATIIQTTPSGGNFGSHITNPSQLTHDYNSLVSISSLGFDLEGESLFSNLTTTLGGGGYSIFDNETIGERDVVFIQSGGGTISFKKTHFYKEFNISLGRDEVKQVTTTSPNQFGTGLGTVIRCISKTDVLGVYRVFHYFASSSVTTDGIYITKYRDWDTNTNTVSSDTTIATLTVTDDPNKTSGNEAKTDLLITINNKIYTFVTHTGSASSSSNNKNYIEVWSQVIDIYSLSVTQGMLIRFDFQDWQAFPGPSWNISGINAGATPVPGKIFQNGTSPAYALYLREWNNTFAGSATVLRNWLIYSNDGITFNIVKIQETSTSSDPDFLLSSLGAGESFNGTAQLNNDGFLYYARDNAGTKRPTYLYNGDTVAISDMPTDVPFHWKPTNIYPMFGTYDNNYIALNGSDWYWADAHTIGLSNQILFPADYTIIYPFSTSASVSIEYYWNAIKISDGRKHILRFSSTGYTSTIDPFSQPTFLQSRGFVSGNFFVDYNSSASLRVLYLDNKSGFPTTGTGYLVLQREGYNYNIIQQAAKPMRVDISNSSPVLTVQDFENTFVSNYIYGDILDQVITFSGLTQREVRDYRYTLLESTRETETTPSGGVSQTILYVEASGVWGTSIEALASGFMLLYTIPSGFAERIETSNYIPSGQYLFVTTSGDYPAFYQKDPEDFFFTSYSGLPVSRATCIRVDDRF